jgi:DMSO/TMAO reductase YedYZ molybdopterin-dependent catalytic subunit
MVQTRGFVGRRGAASVTLPPGQYLTDDLPVLSARPTLHVPLEEWELTIDNGSETLRRWSWKAFRELPTEEIAVDIHCVTRWSKIATAWEGVSLDTLLADIAGDASYALARSFGGYTTNLPLSDLMNKQAWIAFRYDGGELPPEHGGPARLLVPHLYFWKSAKGVRGITLLDHDEPGFWEGFGYHIYGDGGSSGTRATRVAPLHRRRAAG